MNDTQNKWLKGAELAHESDARKRALMTFGNPFGLAFYDKEQEERAVPDIRDRRAVSAAGSVEGQSDATPNKWHKGAELALDLADACERDVGKYDDPDWDDYMKAEAQRHRERAVWWERFAK